MTKKISPNVRLSMEIAQTLDKQKSHLDPSGKMFDEYEHGWNTAIDVCIREVVSWLLHKEVSQNNAKN